MLGTALGALVCLLRTRRSALPRRFAQVYIAVLRGTPVLMLLLLLFYGVLAQYGTPPVTVAFVLALLLIGTVVVQGTRKMYIESQNGQIEQDMGECRALFMNPEIVGRVLDQWQDDPEMMEEPDGALDAQMLERLERSGVSAAEVTPAELDAMSPQAQRAFAKAMYRYMCAWFDDQRLKGRFDGVFIMDIRNDDELYGDDRDDLFVIMESSVDTDESGYHFLGEYWSKEEAFAVIDTLQNGGFGPFPY